MINNKKNNNNSEKRYLEVNRRKVISKTAHFIVDYSKSQTCS